MTYIILKQVKSCLSHYNSVHCGVEVLSMSKIIMNCVFDSANICGVKIYYQYTDSIHLNHDDVDKIVKIYKETYTSYLVGDYLCQFHVDFHKKKRHKEVYAIDSLLLGKKSYVDLLEYVDDNDKSHKIHDDLARMKGFPTSCIQHYATKK